MTLARSTTRFALTAGFAALLALVAVGVRYVTAEVRGAAPAAGQPTVEEPVPFSLTVDPEVAPEQAELPGRDGSLRLVASLADDTGHQVDFVADELLLSTDDKAQLEELLDRWDGQLRGGGGTV